MTTATPRFPATVVNDLHATLARLRRARAENDTEAVLVAEAKLNWILETKIPRPTPAAA